MESIRAHLQITTKNDIGEDRTSRTKVYWDNLTLQPKYVSTDATLEYIHGFSSDSLRKAMGVAGCLQTHRKAWEMISRFDGGVFLISEDDCIPAIDFTVKIDEIFKDPFFQQTHTGTVMSSKSNEAFLLQIGWTSNMKITLKRLTVYFYHLVKFRGPIKARFARHLAFGTHCYLLNPKMANFLLANISSNHIPIDLQFISLSKNPIYNHLKILRTIENLSSQEGIDSHIESTNLSPTINEGKLSYLRQHIESVSIADCPRKLNV